VSEKKRKMLITAGPTREMLDPIRFLSNLSTGEMGYQLAEVAVKENWDVSLISGPTALKPPKGVRFTSIVSVDDLSKACDEQFDRADVLVMIAAVCDFKAERAAKQKISRSNNPTITLKKTKDIVAGLGKHKKNRIVIGFCLETSDWITNAKKKLKKKNLDGIVANYCSKDHNPFGNKRINTAFLDKKGEIVYLKQKNKKQIASKLLEWIELIHKK
jgi:phosphopantothenoylcysteine decarboxylase/phosphopantothenate--cysteine ligase